MWDMSEYDKEAKDSHRFALDTFVYFFTTIDTIKTNILLRGSLRKCHTF